MNGSTGNLVGKIWLLDRRTRGQLLH